MEDKWNDLHVQFILHNSTSTISSSCVFHIDPKQKQKPLKNSCLGVVMVENEKEIQKQKLDSNGDNGGSQQKQYLTFCCFIYNKN